MEINVLAKFKRLSSKDVQEVLKHKSINHEREESIFVWVTQQLAKLPNRSCWALR